VGCRQHIVGVRSEHGETGPVTVATEGSQFDTVLAVYTGTEVGSLTLVEENDDVGPHELRSRVTFEAVAGTRYLLAVDGYANQIGLIRLTVTPLRDAPSAPVIRQAPADQTRFANGEGGGSVVTFRVDATGELPLTYQWFRDGDLIAGATGDVLTVTNAGPAAAGAYQVEVTNAYGSSRSPAAGLTVLAAPFNDDFAARLAVTGVSNVVRGSVLGATKQMGEAHHGAQTGGRSVWWKWIAPSNGPTEIQTVGSNFDTLLAVYSGSELASLRRVAQNDDLVRDVPASRVVFDAVAGTEYAIAVDGMKTNGTSGNVVLTVVQPPPGPRIKVQPPSLSSVPFTEPGFSLAVTVEGEARFARFQWHFNGAPIRNATNATYAFGPLSRAHSGVYFVAITNAFGGTVSRDATLWVEVPQVLERPEVLPDGAVRLRFADPDGTMATDPGRFQVQHAANVGGPEDGWSATPGEIVRSAGRWVFEDWSVVPGETIRAYRVIEQWRTSGVGR
jgi:hypothetical protein